MVRSFEESPHARQLLDEMIESKLTSLWAEAVREDAARHAPRDTGALAASITVERVNARHYRVGSDLPYALAQEFGARPHVIRARRGRVLADRESGEVFGPTVNHPGNPAHPYLRPALYKWRLR